MPFNLAEKSQRRVGFAGLLLVAIIRWWSAVDTPHIKPDEHAYLGAAELVQAGNSAYEDERFFYPPSFAAMVGALQELLGTRALLVLLRGLSVFGACILVWTVSGATNWSPAIRLGIGIVLICLAEPVTVGLVLGNISSLVIGGGLWALAAWPRGRAVLAGLAISAGLLIKPIFALAPLLLVLHRGEERLRATLTGLVAMASASIVLVFYVSEIGPFLGSVSGLAEHPHNLSLYRILWLFGLKLPSLVMPILGLVLGGWSVWRKRLTAKGLLLTICVVVQLSLPLVWIYSLAVVLPVQITAIDALTASGKASRYTTTTRVLVVLGIISIFFSQAVGTGPLEPAWLAAALLAVPVVSPVLLLWWLIDQPDSDLVAPSES